jgi:hypothetical protein
VNKLNDVPNEAKNWINPNTYFKINGKRYVIYFVAMSFLNDKGVYNRIGFRQDEHHYIYFCDDGWELSITVDEVDDAVINGINAAWAKERATK